MYKCILVATDGSKLSSKAIKAAVDMAKSVGARIVGFYAKAEYPGSVYAEGASLGSYGSRAKFNKEQDEQAEAVLQSVVDAAGKEGVAVETIAVHDNVPYQAIISAAGKRKCDLIVMASHGRRGISGLLLGSETQKVLTHSKLPVLVVR
jgi:nucleotide-binding universal stress UspA family protein